MTNPKNTTAYDSGYCDGQASVAEQHATPTQVERWLAPGQETPDTALVNALGVALAIKLGLTEEQVAAAGPEYEAACKNYNMGFAEGARAEAAGKSQP